MKSGVSLIGKNKTGKEFLLPTKVMYFPDSNEAQNYINNILKRYNLQIENTYWFGVEKPEFEIVNKILRFKEISKL